MKLVRLDTRLSDRLILFVTLARPAPPLLKRDETSLHFYRKGISVPFQPLISSNEQYSVEELLPSIWLLGKSAGCTDVPRRARPST